MKKNSSNSILGSMAWSFGERLLAQLISTIVGVVLARALGPNFYGTVAIVTVIIDFLNIFVSSGFSTALVQKKNVDYLDYDSCFALSLFASVILYILLILASPFIADFFHLSKSLIIVLGLRLPISSVNSIQQAMIQRNMKFKSFFIATLWGTIISAVVGISMAYGGFGVWALVAQYMTNTTIDTIVLFIVNDWHPKLRVSKKRVYEILRFGGKVLITNLVTAGQNDLRSLIIGKCFGPADLSYYDNGQKYTSLIVENINSSIGKVMLPVYSKKQDDIVDLLQSIRLSIRVATYAITPMVMGFAVVSYHFVDALLAEKWIGCVPYIKVFCMAYWFRPLCSICVQGILAMGKSEIVLRQMIIINSISIISVLFAAFYLKSVMAIAIFCMLCEFISFAFCIYYSNKIIGYKIKTQFLDILPAVFLSCVMGTAVAILGYALKCNSIIKLIVQVISGFIIYIVLSMLARNQEFIYIAKKIQQYI